MNFVKEQPLVSVIMCTYNASRFIKATLDSVLSQTYKHFEFLILDNASIDDTTDIVQGYAETDNRVQLYINRKNEGAYPGYNYLIKKSNGRYIAIQDHDDIWHPDKLKLQVNFLESNNSYIGCGSHLLKYYEGLRKYKWIKVKETGRFCPHPSLIFRNKGYEYDTTISYKTDIYFMRYILCNDNTNILYNIPKPLYVSRVRADGKNLNYLWAKPKGVFCYFKKTRDYSKLIFGLIRFILPFDVIDSLSMRLHGTDVAKLKNDSFTDPFYEFITQTERYQSVNTNEKISK